MPTLILSKTAIDLSFVDQDSWIILVLGIIILFTMKLSSSSRSSRVNNVNK